MNASFTKVIKANENRGSDTNSVNDPEDLAKGSYVSIQVGSDYNDSCKFGMFCRENKDMWTMPLFEYTCQSCSSEFELLLRNSEDPLCPECNSDRLNRHLSAASVHGVMPSSKTGNCSAVPT